MLVPHSGNQCGLSLCYQWICEDLLRSVCSSSPWNNHTLPSCFYRRQKKHSWYRSLALPQRCCWKMASSGWRVTLQLAQSLQVLLEQRLILYLTWKCSHIWAPWFPWEVVAFNSYNLGHCFGENKLGHRFDEGSGLLDLLMPHTCCNERGILSLLSSMFYIKGGLNCLVAFI